MFFFISFILTEISVLRWGCSEFPSSPEVCHSGTLFWAERKESFLTPLLLVSTLQGNWNASIRMAPKELLLKYLLFVLPCKNIFKKKKKKQLPQKGQHKHCHFFVTKRWQFNLKAKKTSLRNYVNAYGYQTRLTQIGWSASHEDTLKAQCSVQPENPTKSKNRGTQECFK